MDITRLKHAVADADVPWVGVAILRNSPDPSRHTGIVYRHPGTGALHLADMAWHRNFRNQPYNPAWGYWCAVPHFADPIIEESFADYCAHVAASLPARKPPYNLLSAENTQFDSAGVWVSRDPDGGMNCSSFVAAVFQSYNCPLVNVQTWPVGLPRDIQEQTDLVCKFVNSVSQEDRKQAYKMSPQIGRHARIRPEEAAGACLEDDAARPLNQTLSVIVKRPSPDPNAVKETPCFAGKNASC